MMGISVINEKELGREIVDALVGKLPTILATLKQHRLDAMITVRGMEIKLSLSAEDKTL